MIFVFAIRSMKAWGWWWGLPLLLGGLIAGVISYGSHDAITYFLTSGPLSTIPANIRAESLGAVQSIAQTVFQPMFRQSTVISVIGLVLVMIGISARGKSDY